MRSPLPQLDSARVLSDAVTKSLREAILAGQFEPGEKLDQDLIAQELGVSRTPVREALRSLASEGFIEVRPHYGAFIVAVSRREISEIYQFRRLVEVEIARKATGMITDSVLEQLEQAILADRARVERGDTNGHFAADTLFEETVRAYSDNRLLADVLAGLDNRISGLRRLALCQPSHQLLASLDEHLAIIAAFRRRDPDRAAELTQAHLKASEQRLLEAIA